jgi:hypothetical protein
MKALPILILFSLGFGFFGLSSNILAQQLEAPTRVRIDYWRAFDDEIIEDIEIGPNGRYNVSTQMKPQRQECKATIHLPSREIEPKTLQPLTQFFNDLKIRKAFVNSKHVLTTDGSYLEVTVEQNSFSVTFGSQWALDTRPPAADEKLGTLVAELSKAAGVDIQGNSSWLDIDVPKLEFEASSFGDAIDHFMKLTCAEGYLIPARIYLLSSIKADQKISVAAANRSVSSILQEVCDHFGLTFTLSADIAVAGTPEDLTRFRKAFRATSLFPRGWDVYVPRVVFHQATVHDTVGFFNRKLAENPGAKKLAITLVGHGEHDCNFDGVQVPVSALFSVIASDIGVPLSEVATVHQ